jgi:hypothetical protein
LIEQIIEELRESHEFPPLTVTVIKTFPGHLGNFLRWIVARRGVTCEQAAEFFGEAEEDARSLIIELAAHSLIEHVPTCGVPVYRVCLVPRRLRVPPELM